VDTCVIDGVRYETAPETRFCDGCVFFSIDECESLVGTVCSEKEVIWIKAEHQPTDDFTHGKVVYEKDYDIVSKPKHYMLFEEQGIEVRDVIEKLVEKIDESRMPYSALFDSDYVQMMQYLMRFMDKNGKQDLEKARWYLDKLIESYDN
jgi:hypothetical protein